MEAKHHKKVHQLFLGGILLKGAFALSELISGMFVYFGGGFLLQFFITLSKAELAVNPDNRLALEAIRMSEHIDLHAEHFIALYLLVRGLIKLILIYGLLKEKIQYYIFSIVIFGIFIAYELYRLVFHFSPWLIGLIMFDSAIVSLITYEYIQKRK